MTTTLVYGSATDGYLHSYDASYANSRNGPADATNFSATGYYGQNNNASQYGTFQTFIAFSYSAIAATELVTSAVVLLHQTVQLSTGVARDMEVRGFTWTGSGLSTADWRTPAQLAAARLDGVVKNVQGSVGKVTQAGSDELLAAMISVTAMEHVIVSSRQRAGTTPTTDEGSAVATARTSGTTSDPVLLFTTLTRTHFTPVLGAVAQLSDGAMVHLISDGSAVPTSVGLWRVPLTGGGATQIGSVGTTTNSFDFAPTKGSQGLTLCVDTADNIYVVGKVGNAENTVAVKCWVKGVGLTWTPGGLKTAALPTYDASINNVSAAWHPTASGTLMVVAGHTAGQGVSGGTGNEMAYALLDATHTRTNAGTFVRAIGSLLGSILAATTSTIFNTYGNETGTGLDVVADRFQADWGYVFSFTKGVIPGTNADLGCGRYVLNAAGNGFTHTSVEDSVSWGMKDAGSKLRVLSIGDGQIAVVSADADAGWGLTVEAFQASGTTAGMTSLGGEALAGESIASMPDGPAVATVSWWDAIYNSAENSVWVYYRHASDSTKLMRTSVDLNTYQATRAEVEVYDTGTAVITSVRVARNGVITDKTQVGVCTLAGATLGHVEITDSYNLAPTAPILTPKANYDATAASVFAWSFGDPNPGDTQSAYEMEVERVDTGAVALDTGKVTSTTSSRSVAGATFTNGLEYRWRIRVWDALDSVGPFSTWGTFSTSAGGTVTITDPATDNLTTLITDEAQITWSVSGTTQASYRVILKRNDTNATVSDTNWVASTGTQLLVTGMVTGVEHTASVQVRNAALVVSGIGTRKLTPNYGVPEIPLVTVAPVEDEGYVLVTVDNPISGQPVLGTVEWDGEDTTTTGWVGNSATVANSTDFAHGGSRSLKITTTGSPVQAYARRELLAGIVPTERYTARMWVYSATARSLSASIDWANAGGYLSTTALAVAVPAAAWTEIQVTGTAPDTADRVSFGPTITGSPTTGTIIYTDDVILVAASDRPAVTSNRVLRRKAGSGDAWEVLGTCAPDGSFRDYTAPGRVPVEYMIRGDAQ